MARFEKVGDTLGYRNGHQILPIEYKGRRPFTRKIIKYDRFERIDKYIFRNKDNTFDLLMVILHDITFIYKLAYWQKSINHLRLIKLL